MTLNLQHAAQLGKAVPFVDVADHIDQVLLPAFALKKVRSGITEAQITILSYGAGTQTNVLLALAIFNWCNQSAPSSAGSLDVDLIMFANVSDDGTECEWEHTIEYMNAMRYFSDIAFVSVSPTIWNTTLAEDASGLFDRYVSREIIPIRMFRSCTDHFKIRPQENAMRYLHKELRTMGIELTIRQIIGYSYDEKERAERFIPAGDFVTPWFPLIEWKWTREQTIREFSQRFPDIKATIGLPRKSGCWFCPFQKRGTFDPVTLEPQQHTWLHLVTKAPDLFEKAVDMETVQNVRREKEGKKPIYLYGKKPLTYWMAPERRNVQQTLFADDLEEGELRTDDMCSSWGCFR